MTPVEPGIHPVAEIYPEMSAEQFAGLVESVRLRGLREPIWLHPDGRIIDGRHRYRACVEAGVTPEFQTWQDDGSLVSFVVDRNSHRRDLNQSQKALVALRVEEHYAAEAKERQRAAGGGAGRRGGDERTLGEILPQANGRAPRSRDQAAAALGVSGRYIQDAKKVADEAPEMLPKIESGEMSVNEAKKKLAEPGHVARKARRTPLPDAAKKAGWDFRRAIERLERLADDDRFPTNRQQVATQWSGHLSYAIRVCQDLIDRLNQPEEEGQ